MGLNFSDDDCKCLYDVPVVLNLEKVREVSEVVRRAAGYTLEAWKPLVGQNLFYPGRAGFVTIKCRRLHPRAQPGPVFDR